MHKSAVEWTSRWYNAKDYADKGTNVFKEYRFKFEPIYWMQNIKIKYFGSKLKRVRICFENNSF